MSAFSVSCRLVSHEWSGSVDAVPIALHASRPADRKSHAIPILDRERRRALLFFSSFLFPFVSQPLLVKAFENTWCVGEFEVFLFFKCCCFLVLKIENYSYSSGREIAKPIRRVSSIVDWWSVTADAATVSRVLWVFSRQRVTRPCQRSRNQKCLFLSKSRWRIQGNPVKSRGEYIVAIKSRNRERKKNGSF